MSTTKMVFHGSDIEKICEIYHLKQENIVKFGANVNPLGLSENVKKQLASHLDILSSYPDRDYTSLRNTISDYCNVPANFILPGNGSSELIALLIQERNPKHTLILGPTYSEYSRELSFSGSTQEYYHLREERNFTLDVEDLCKTLENGYDFLILCNPNNPTSSAIMQEDLRKLIAFCADKDIFVMIDETYVEFVNSDYYIESGNFFRIRNVQLAYAFDKSLLAKIRLQALKVYVNIQNLKTWKHNTGYTPELGGTATAFGVDNGSYPVPAVYTFGINLTF